MKKKIKLTESDLENIIKRVLNEQTTTPIKEAITAPSTNKRETLLCPIQCKKKVLGKGNAGEDVKLIQNALHNCGFNPEKFGGGMKVGCDKDYKKCDGKFNAETDKAVREFQKSVSITDDGLVGPKTLVKMMTVDGLKRGVRGTDSCLSLVKCDCKKKPGEIRNLAPTDKVTVGCKKSISCFEKHKNDVCGLANCLGICIPDGMCKGEKYIERLDLSTTEYTTEV